LRGVGGCDSCDGDKDLVLGRLVAVLTSDWSPKLCKLGPIGQPVTRRLTGRLVFWPIAASILRSDSESAVNRRVRRAASWEPSGRCLRRCLRVRSGTARYQAAVRKTRPKTMIHELSAEYLSRM
jgi:hypothetical protein